MARFAKHPFISESVTLMPVRFRPRLPMVSADSRRSDLTRGRTHVSALVIGNRVEQVTPALTDRSPQ